MSISEIKNETTIAAIAEDPTGNLHYLLFGVIIDVSEPTKLEESKNYITKLKVVDPSFNYKEELKISQLKFHKFIHVNIFTETPEDAPKVTYIGDIIRLRRFKFKYTSKGEIMGNDIKYSNWLIYSGKKDDSEISTSYKRYEKNLNRKLNKYEENRLKDLRNWNDNFFFKHSLKYVSWWNDLKETHDPKKKGKYVYEQVDLIIKCKSVEPKKNTIEFIDKDNVNFLLSIKDTPSIKVNQIIKLRCVIVTVEVAASGSTSRHIKLSNLSSCLLLPNASYDYRQFDKSVQDAKKSPAKSVKNEALPFITEYSLPDTKSKSVKKGKNEAHYVTAIKKNYNSHKVEKVDNLLKHLENSGSNHGNKFLVDGFIAGFATTDPTKIIKKIGVDDKKLHDIKDETVKDKRSKIIYHFIMQVKDPSVEDTDKFLNVYVLTGEFESRLFDCWKLLPQIDDITGWKNLKQSTYNDFEKRLNSLKNPENKVKLVVELMITKSSKPFYRLVDTIFTA